MAKRTRDGSSTKTGSATSGRRITAMVAAADKPENVVQAQLGCEFVLFNTPLRGVYEKGASSQTFVIYEPDAGKQRTGLTVAQIADQLKAMVDKISGGDSSPTVTFTWPSQTAKEIANGLSICLHQAFLKASKKTGDEKWTLDGYALWISVDASQKLLDAFDLPIMINSVYLKVWQTDNEKILAEMDISQIDDLINAPDPKGLPRAR
jgi:hypothetical protein